jgi:amino acid transporter
MVTRDPGAEPVHESPHVGLKPGAIGFFDALVIGLASTSPAYSLAAVIAPIVLLVGVYAPGVLLASFVPMLLIASAFYYLNSVDQDCGTTFSWVTRAMGPWFGWLGGWAIAMTGVLVIGSLAEVGVYFSMYAFGLDSAAEHVWLVRGLTVALILVMTAICVWGTEVSARLQNALIVAQVLALVAFAVVALVRVANDSSSLDSITPSLSWLNPFGEGGAGLTGGLLLGVFATGAGSRRSTSPRRPPTPRAPPAAPASSRPWCCSAPTSPSRSPSSRTPARRSSRRTAPRRSTSSRCSRPR